MSKEAHVQKQVIIDEIKEKLDKAQAAVVVDYVGVTVEEANGMRKKFREAGVDYSVYKNTLMKRAIDGTVYEELGQVLSGPSAFAFGYEDATAPARVINEVVKDLEKLEFKAGVIEGTFFDAAGIKKIASIPARETLIAKFMGSIQSPVSKMVRTLAAVAQAKAEGGAAEAPAEEAKAETPTEAPAEAKEAATETAEATPAEATAPEEATKEADGPAEAKAEEAAETKEAPEASAEAESKEAAPADAQAPDTEETPEA